jgi:hypothetical protein
MGSLSRERSFSDLQVSSVFFSSTKRLEDFLGSDTLLRSMTLATTS